MWEFCLSLYGGNADWFELDKNNESDGIPFIMPTGRDAGFTSLCYDIPTKQTGIVILLNVGIGEDKLTLLKDDMVMALFKGYCGIEEI